MPTNDDVLTWDDTLASNQKWAAPTGGTPAAEDVTFTPAGSIAATDVQAAIEEVAAEAGGGGGGTFHGARVRRSTPGSLNTSSVTIISWDVEDYDTDAYHDNSTNPSRITIPTGLGGKYLVSVMVGNFFVSSAAGRRFCTLLKNGSNWQRKEVAVPSTGETWIDLTMQEEFADGDYLEVDAFQNSGSNGAVLSTNRGTDGGICYFAVYLIAT